MIFILYDGFRHFVSGSVSICRRSVLPPQKELSSAAADEIRKSIFSSIEFVDNRHSAPQLRSKLIKLYRGHKYFQISIYKVTIGLCVFVCTNFISTGTVNLGEFDILYPISFLIYIIQF